MDTISNDYFKKLLYDKTGIRISDAKSELLQIKLQRIMRKKNIVNIHDYYNHLKKSVSGNEMQDFINTFTTNTTLFFREPNHFDYLQLHMSAILKANPSIKEKGEIRVWCAACSTGQESVTLAMVLKEFLPKDISIRLLATDIDSTVLSRALSGFYTKEEIHNIPRYFLGKYFSLTEDGYQVQDELRQIITYRQFNLMHDFPFKHTFHLVFCRNVMIYFDRQVQQRLIDKFYDCIGTGGFLFVGNSESLLSKKHKFLSTGPSIYQKVM